MQLMFSFMRVCFLSKFSLIFFFFNDTATTEIYTLSLHDALPIPDQTPDAPQRRKLLLMALIGSIGIAVGAVLLAEHIDTSFHSVEDLRAFSAVPVLVSIPR